MPPGQQHRCVPPAFLSLQLLFTAVLYSNVRQGLGFNIAENAGPATAFKLIGNEDLQAETSAKVKDEGNDIKAIQSRGTLPKPVESSEKPTESRSEPSSGPRGSLAENSGVNNLKTFVGSLSEVIRSFLNSGAHGRSQGDSQEGQPPNSPRGENNDTSKIQEHKEDGGTGVSDFQNSVHKPEEGLGEVQNKQKAEDNPSVEEPHATQSSETKKTDSGDSSAGSGAKDVANQGNDLNRVGETGSQTAHEALDENHESGPKRGAEDGDTTQSAENTSQEKQRPRNPTFSSNSGEPGGNSEVHGTSENNSDGKSEGDLAHREPAPTVITRQKQTNIREITIVNFVVWNLGKAAGVKTIGLKRKEISAKLTMSANRIQIASSAGTRFSQQREKRVQPDRGSYQIYRGVIINGRVLSFKKLRSTAYGGSRSVGILDARLAVALFCQRRYAQKINLTLQLQCRIWRRKYRKLFYQYEKLGGFPRYNRGSYEARGRSRTNKGTHHTQDKDDAPSAKEADVGGIKRRGELHNLAERSEVDRERSAPRLARGAVLS